MSVKSCCCSMLTYSLLNFALLGNNVSRGVVYIRYLRMGPFRRNLSFIEASICESWSTINY